MNRYLQLIPRGLFSSILRLLAACLLCVLGTHGSDRLEQRARELARKIAIELPGKEATLTVHNLSSLPASDARTVRRELENELYTQGIQLQESAPSEVRVTLSEHVRGYLLVAEILHEDSREVVMVEIGRGLDSRKPSAATLSLQKEFVFEQADPILDFDFVSVDGADSPGLHVLTPTAVNLYVNKDQGWRLQASWSIPHGTAWPHDLRGHLERAEPGVAHLPGVRCVGEADGSMRCLEDRDLWPLSDQHDLRLAAGVAAGRNFFDRSSFVPRQGEGLPPFFSAAVFKSAADVLRAFAGVDGITRVYRDDGTLLLTIPGWGSDLASIHSGCGSGWQVLAPWPGDWTQPDAIQAYEIIEPEAAAVGPRVEFPGPVTALWSGPRSEHVVAAVHNLETGRYEGYRLSIACGR